MSKNCRKGQKGNLSKFGRRIPSQKQNSSPSGNFSLFIIRFKTQTSSIFPAQIWSLLVTGPGWGSQSSNTTAKHAAESQIARRHPMTVFTCRSDGCYDPIINWKPGRTRDIAFDRLFPRIPNRFRLIAPIQFDMLNQPVNHYQ